MASPYSTGGGGTHFEARVTASYLAAILSETPARGLLGQYAVKAQTQRAAFGEPLDDIIVEGRREDGGSTKLHLQIKSRLTFTEKDAEWNNVLKSAWDTFSAQGFDVETERVGVGIAAYNARVDQHYQSVLSWANHSIDGNHFVERIEKEDFSHADKRGFVNSIRNILTAHVGRALADDELFGLLRCFVIMHFDFQSEHSSRDVIAVIDRLRGLLAPHKRDQANRIWEHLVENAGQLIPVGGGATRGTLIQNLTAVELPTGTASSSRKDIQAINSESSAALGHIKSSIHGLKLHRAKAYQDLRVALTDGRFIQITGEPGTGKSALIKQLAEECERTGPVFVLESGRVHPRGWTAHAHILGISENLGALLCEFACSGDAILFIDGIDKITDPAVHLTVNDLVREIAQNRNLSKWRIVTTVREQNLKHIETWLDPDALNKLPLRTITMAPLNETTLRVVAEQFPRLESLLLEPGKLDVILRRPFFLNALLTLAGREGAAELPATEVELLRLWWKLGGTDRADFSPAQHRRNALLGLAELLAHSPNEPVSITGIPPEPIEELKSAGVLRDKEFGHSAVFTHDIYEEWALTELLLSHGTEIRDFLRATGEPQALVRPMQLLGAHVLETDDSVEVWKSLFEELGEQSLRLVWQRAMLSSCLQSTRALHLLENLSEYLLENSGERLKKLLLAIQTIEVLPNPVFLDEKMMPELEPAERVKFAHHSAMPKPLTWIRFLDWLVPQMDSLAPSLIPDLLPVFTTWQNAFAGQKVRHCRKFGEITYRWLIEFEEATHPKRWEDRRNPFGINVGYEDESNLEKSIRSTFLASAGDVPQLATDYLRAKALNKERKHVFRDDILANSGALARHLPSELVDFILEVYLERPADHSDPYGGYRDHLTDGLGIAGHHQFYPASPLQMPFLSLLRQHEEEGLRLIRELCNHSVSIWRWSCENRNRHEPVTPIPVRLTFPWGRQVFWGDGRVYLWFRGAWGNHAVGSALMALEQWAFDQIKQGAEFAEIFRKVIEGNDSAAALGIGTSLCLALPDKSIECSFPLITCPYLWKWDIARSVNDKGYQANEMGNWQQYGHLLTAVKLLNQKEHRQQDIRSLVPYFVFWRDKKVKNKYARRIREFPKRLPFEYEQEKLQPDFAKHLLEEMSLFAEQGSPKHWKTAPTEDGKGIQIWSEPPSLNKEKYRLQQEEYAHLNECMGLALWAQKSLDEGSLDERFSVEQGVAKAKELDVPGLFNLHLGSDDLAATQNAAAVAGTAFAAARHATKAEWSDELGSWCLDVLERAATTIEIPDALLMRGTNMSMHPTVFTAHGYSALLARGHEKRLCKSALLNLAVDAMEDVASAVYASSKWYVSSEPEFIWILLDIAARQCIVHEHEIPDFHTTSWDEQEASYKLSLLDRAEKFVETGEQPELPTIPMPWVQVGMPSEPSHNDTKGYSKNCVAFLYHIAEKTLLQICVEPILTDTGRRRQFSALMHELLTYTVQEIVPPFASSTRDHSGDTPFEWIVSFSSWCGRICAHLSPAECRHVIFDHVFTQDNETALMIMEYLMRSFMIEAFLRQENISKNNLVIWHELADWLFGNVEWKYGKDGDHLDRKFQGCAFTTLFCVAPDFSSLICGIDPEWPHLEKFRPIVERAVREFGLHPTLYLAVTVFLKRGGFDLLPDPALAWLSEIVAAKKQDRKFWSVNGDDTVDILKMLTEKKGAQLGPSHHDMIALILDILVDNGVRGAGFLQQEFSRS